MAGRREGPDVTVIETDGGAGFKWFVVGALIGAGVGLLLAPQSGARTRRDLGRKARRLRAQAEERLEELTDDLGERGRRIAGTVEEWVDTVSDGVEEGRRTVERSAHAAREELERRVSSARSRRRAAIAADGVAEDDDADD